MTHLTSSFRTKRSVVRNLNFRLSNFTTSSEMAILFSPNSPPLLPSFHALPPIHYPIASLSAVSLNIKFEQISFKIKNIMATKRIFTINGSSINNMIKGLFSNINNLRFVATFKSGNNIVNLPLLLVIILAIVFPVTLVAGVILSIIFKIDIAIERDITRDIKLIENK